MNTNKISNWRKQQQQKATTRFNFEKYKQQSRYFLRLSEQIR